MKEKQNTNIFTMSQTFEPHCRKIKAYSFVGLQHVVCPCLEVLMTIIIIVSSAQFDSGVLAVEAHLQQNGNVN